MGLELRDNSLVSIPDFFPMLISSLNSMDFIFPQYHLEHSFSLLRYLPVLLNKVNSIHIFLKSLL